LENESNTLTKKKMMPQQPTRIIPIQAAIPNAEEPLEKIRL
jgi:hypothetical protein